MSDFKSLEVIPYSNLGHLHKPSIQALIHGLNRHYYSIAISCRCRALHASPKAVQRLFTLFCRIHYMHGIHPWAEPAMYSSRVASAQACVASEALSR